MNNLDPEKQEKLKEERRMKEEEAKKEAKKNEELAALKRAASFQYSQPRIKMTRANAPCSSCHQMGHWATDPGKYLQIFSILSGTKNLSLFRMSSQGTECDDQASTSCQPSTRRSSGRKPRSEIKRLLKLHSVFRRF